MARIFFYLLLLLNRYCNSNDNQASLSTITPTNFDNDTNPSQKPDDSRSRMYWVYYGILILTLMGMLFSMIAFGWVGKAIIAKRQRVKPAKPDEEMNNLPPGTTKVTKELWQSIIRGKVHPNLVMVPLPNRKVLQNPETIDKWRSIVRATVRFSKTNTPDGTRTGKSTRRPRSHSVKSLVVSSPSGNTSDDDTISKVANKSEAKKLGKSGTQSRSKSAKSLPAIASSPKSAKSLPANASSPNGDISEDDSIFKVAKKPFTRARSKSVKSAKSLITPNISDDDKPSNVAKKPDAKIQRKSIHRARSKSVKSIKASVPSTNLNMPEAGNASKVANKSDAKKPGKSTR